MGMSASQARLLMLTARKSDLEYQAQQICQAKLALAQEEEAISTEYNNSISNTKFGILSYRKIDGQTQQYVEDLTYTSIDTAGYYLIDSNGKIVKSSDDYTAGYNSANDKQAYENTYVSDDIIATDKGGAESYIKLMLDKGEFMLVRKSDNQKTTVSMTKDLTEIYDKEDDGAAEAKYKEATAKIQTKEKKLDLQLKQIETQHSAVTNEMESVDKIVKDNVEKSFKTFA